MRIFPAPAVVERDPKLQLRMRREFVIGPLEQEIPVELNRLLRLSEEAAVDGFVVRRAGGQVFILGLPNLFEMIGRPLVDILKMIQPREAVERAVMVLAVRIALREPAIVDHRILAVAELVVGFRQQKEGALLRLRPERRQTSLELPDGALIIPHLVIHLGERDAHDAGIW